MQNQIKGESSMNDADRNANPTEAKKLMELGSTLGLTKLEIVRTTFFLGMQILCLIFSPLAGGFNRTVWSMLDSALLVLAIGVTSLIYVIDSPNFRRTALYAAIAIYVLAIVDMSVNILITGLVGWVDR
jgi:hypothetical protein